jgi:hypothetical protein
MHAGQHSFAVGNIGWDKACGWIVLSRLDATERNRDFGISDENRREFFEPVWWDCAIVVREYNYRTFGLFKSRIERIPFADSCASHVPQAGIRPNRL